MIDAADTSTTALAAVFILAAVAVAWGGTRLARTAQAFAYQTGVGQALVGAVFIGITTSLAGTVLSFHAAFRGQAELAIANSLGGIAAQIVFLAIADLTYRKVNIEYVGASLANIVQGVLLIILLAIALLAVAAPEITVLEVHPVSVVLVVVYLVGLRVAHAIEKRPMWSPKTTAETQQESSTDERSAKTIAQLSLVLLALMVIMFVAGVSLSITATELSARTGFSQTLMGGMVTSVVTSLPELITCLAAVRAGAINLAIGDIMGGNTFDVLFLAGSDAFYRDGSLYHQMSGQGQILAAAGIIMTGVLVMGLLGRQKQGPAHIGLESVLLLAGYAGLVWLLIASS